MYWIEIVPALLLGTAFLLVPGLAMGVVLGLRSIPLISRAPMLSVGMIGVGAILLSWMGIAFTPFSLALTCGAFVLVGLGLRFFLGSMAGSRADEADRASAEKVGAGQYWLIAVAVVAAAVTIFLRIKQGIINPDALAQLTDVVFHLNAVEHILDSGDGSTLTLGGAVNATGAPALYPAAWHDLHALIHGIVGGSIVASANATVIIVAAVAWPLSLLSLAWALRDVHRSTYLVAGIVAFAGLTLAFPSPLLTWGVLYPTMLGMALVPALMAVAIELMRAVEGRDRSTIVAASGQMLLGAAALVLAQPSTLVSAAVLLIPFLVHSAVSQFRLEPHARRPSLLFTGLVLLGVAVGWVLVRPAREKWWEQGVLGYGETWGPTLQTAHAVGDFLTSAIGYDPVFWVFTLLTWVGAWVAWQGPRSRWVVISWLLSGLLWMVASAWDFSLVRTMLVGPWYNDANRVVTLTAIPAAILGGIGVGAIAERLEALARRVAPAGRSGPARVAVAILTLTVLFLAGGSAPVKDAWGEVSKDYEVHEQSILLTEDELDVMRHIDRHVPPEDIILVNPWEGGALAYSMVDRDVSSRHVGTTVRAPYTTIVANIDDPAQRDQVCELIQKTGARWYLDFEDGADMGGAQNDKYAPLEDAVDAGLMTEVYAAGDVGLYRIDMC